MTCVWGGDRQSRSLSYDYILIPIRTIIDINTIAHCVALPSSALMHRSRCNVRTRTRSQSCAAGMPSVRRDASFEHCSRYVAPLRSVRLEQRAAPACHRERTSCGARLDHMSFPREGFIEQCRLVRACRQKQRAATAERAATAQRVAATALGAVSPGFESD